MLVPGCKADPAELVSAGLVPTGHMVATAVLLNRHQAFWTVLCPSRNPVERLTVIAALLEPFLEHVTLDRVVPVLATGEAETVPAATSDRVASHQLNPGHPATVFGAPAQPAVTGHKVVGDEALVFCDDTLVHD